MTPDSDLASDDKELEGTRLPEDTYAVVRQHQQASNQGHEAGLGKQSSKSHSELASVSEEEPDGDRGQRGSNRKHTEGLADKLRLYLLSQEFKASVQVTVGKKAVAICTALMRAS